MPALTSVDAAIVDWKCEIEQLKKEGALDAEDIEFLESFHRSLEDLRHGRVHDADNF